MTLSPLARRVRSAGLAIWLVVLVSALYLYFFRRELVRTEIQGAFSVSSFVASALYLVLGSVRAFTLIPVTYLILVAVPFFKPTTLFALTLIGIAVSSASIYWFSESLHLEEVFERKHKAEVEKVKGVLQRHELAIIIGWSFFPITPTDVICYVCGALKVNFAKFMVGILIGEGTICALYIFLGDYIVRLLHL